MDEPRPRASLSLGRVAGAATFLHWSFPVGVVLLGGGLQATAQSALAALLLLFLHVVGHWAVARLAAAEVVVAELTGLGGSVRWRGAPGPLLAPLEAWGGVLMQGLVLGAAAALLPVGSALRETLVDRNAWLLAVNLLPVPGFEGAEAWQLPWRLGRRLRARLSGRAPEEPQPLLEVDVPPMEDDELQGPQAAEAKRIAAALLESARHGEEDERP